MRSMLVLVNPPEDIEDRLSELWALAVKHSVEKVFLASVSRPFGSRVLSIVARHRLKMAAHIGDEAAGKYLERLAGELRQRGLDIEAVKTRIPAEEIDSYITKRNIDLLVCSERAAELPSCRTRITTITSMPAILQRES